VHRPPDVTLEIRLLSPSTGQPHPLAEQPIIFVATRRRPVDIICVHIEIVGDFLVYLIYFEAWSQNKDLFSLVRWKKGKVHFVSLSVTAHSSTVA